MVHRVFKGMIPHMNRKNVELDLTRRYNTEQALRHLSDGGLDPRLGSAFQLTKDPALRSLAKGWYVTGTEAPTQDCGDEQDENEGDKDDGEKDGGDEDGKQTM